MKHVTIYALSTCPWCAKAKRYFAERSVPFDAVDYDLADIETQRRIMSEMDELGVSGFPFVRVGATVVVGYNPDKYTRALDEK